MKSKDFYLDLKDRANIRTQFVNPPIPLRCFDWVAWYDEEENKTGTGATEEQAISNLIEQ